MFNERSKILDLIEEGKITPEEGARLLEAMAPPAETRSSASGSPTQPPSSAGGWGRWPGGKGLAERAGRHHLQIGHRLDRKDLQESLRDLSQEIRDAVRSGVAAVLGEEDADYRAGFEEFAGAVLPLPAGPLPRITARCAGGNLRVARGQARVVHIDGEAKFRVFTRELGAEGGEVLIKAREGDLVVEVPSDLAALEVRSDGGDAEIDLDVTDLVAVAAGGDLRFTGLARRVSATAAGGEVRLDRLRLTTGESKVRTAGGDLHLVLTADSDVAITAKTVGGSVNLPGGSKGRSKQVGPVAKSEVVLGRGAASLKLGSAGGDLTVEVES